MLMFSNFIGWWNTRCGALMLCVRLIPRGPLSGDSVLRSGDSLLRSGDNLLVCVSVGTLCARLPCGMTYLGESFGGSLTYEADLDSCVGDFCGDDGSFSGDGLRGGDFLGGLSESRGGDFLGGLSASRGSTCIGIWNTLGLCIGLPAESLEPVELLVAAEDPVELCLSFCFCHVDLLSGDVSRATRMGMPKPEEW